MKMYMMKIMIIMSTMSMKTKNPMSMGMILLIQTLVMTLMMNKIMSSAWFSMITFIMMIGGMMILFIYMSTVASDNKFKMTLSMSWTLMIMFIINEELMIEFQMQEMLNMNSQDEIKSMLKIYNKSMLTTVFMMMYLMLTMISINKIIKFNKGPMRLKN